jgi:hypothetical protein
MLASVLVAALPVAAVLVLLLLQLHLHLYDLVILEGLFSQDIFEVQDSHCTEQYMGGEAKATDFLL